MNDLTFVIGNHIEKCEKVLEKRELTEMISLRKQLVDLYYGKITQITLLGQYEMKNDEYSVIENLNTIKESLILYRGEKVYELKLERNKSTALNLKSESNIHNNTPVKFENIGNVSDSGNSTNTNNNTNSNTNTVDLKAMFKDARDLIEDDEALGEEEVKEIIDKINEIEEVSEEDTSKPKKWRKLKECVGWLSTKGVKVATTVMPLIMKILEEQNN